MPGFRTHGSRTEAGRDERGFPAEWTCWRAAPLGRRSFDAGEARGGRGGLGLNSRTPHLGSTPGLPRRGRIRLLPGFSALSRTLTRRAVCRNPHGGPLRQCVHAGLVRIGRGVSAGPGEDRGGQPSPCGFSLMLRLVSLDPARRRAAPDTGVRGRSVWRCGCSFPPTRPKQHLHGRRWRSWR